ncbi:hypothetical protein BH11ARM2_BH11ARM2_32500 [soil metagenome]
MIVADIGAGSGTLTFPMARKVAPNGTALAVDIQPEMLDLVRARAKKAGIGNVRTVLGTTMNPKVPAGSADLMLLVDVYHEFDHPYEMTANMLKGLKKGGRLVIVEYRAEDPDVPIKELHKMSQGKFAKKSACFRL